MIHSYYDEWWENPLDIRHRVFERLNQEVYSQLSGESGTRALDLGAGKGRVTAMLESLGFHTTAVEYNPKFVQVLQKSFPQSEIVFADLRSWVPRHDYDVATCIEVSQVLSHEELFELLVRLRPHVRRILLSISNSKSLHGGWVRFRRFRAPFIVPYRVSDLRRILSAARFEVLRTTGVGFVTPISLLREFRAPLIGERTSQRLSKLDQVFPHLCHLVLVVAKPLASYDRKGRLCEQTGVVVETHSSIGQVVSR